PPPARGTPAARQPTAALPCASLPSRWLRPQTADLRSRRIRSLDFVDDNTNGSVVRPAAIGATRSRAPCSTPSVVNPGERYLCWSARPPPLPGRVGQVGTGSRGFAKNADPG